MHDTTSHAGPPSTVRVFRQLLSPTRRGARFARLLAAGALRAWDVPAEITGRAEHIVAELAANAVFHGRVHSRDFRITVRLDTAAAVLRLEVTDARGDRRPVSRGALPPDAESGRGMLLVAVLADRWGTDPHPPSGKTVWAELDLPAEAVSGRWSAPR